MTWPRTSRQSRGYDRDWERVRLQVLQRDLYICRCPDCVGGALRVRLASEVDHITPLAQGGARLDPANLRAVHRECHRRLTLRQQGHNPPRRYDKYGRRIE